MSVCTLYARSKYRLCLPISSVLFPDSTTNCRAKMLYMYETRKQCEFGTQKLAKRDRSKPKKQQKMMFFEKRYKSSILGVDSLPTQAYNPPPLPAQWQ